MLRTFYPIVSVAELQRARLERPAYFAAGVLFGTHGEKFRLPDGRTFDLIFNVDGPPAARRWQVIETTGGAADDPFPLEPGPLVPLDVDALPAPGAGDAPPLETFVAAALGEFGAAESILGTIAGDVAEAVTPAELGDLDEGELAGAHAQLEAEARDFDAVNPIALITATRALGGVANDQVDARPGSGPDEEPLPDPGPPRDDHEPPRDPDERPGKGQEP